jgi:hypothetical protein
MSITGTFARAVPLLLAATFGSSRIREPGPPRAAPGLVRWSPVRTRLMPGVPNASPVSLMGRDPPGDAAAVRPWP